MKESIFRKELSVTGKYGTKTAVVIASMNYGSKTVNGTHAYTHDDFSKKIPIHKVEVLVNGVSWKKTDEIDNEREVFNESEKWIREATLYITKLANEAPAKSFADKMKELFD